MPDPVVRETPPPSIQTAGATFTWHPDSPIYPALDLDALTYPEGTK